MSAAHVSDRVATPGRERRQVSIDWKNERSRWGGAYARACRITKASTATGERDALGSSTPVFVAAAAAAATEEEEEEDVPTPNGDAENSKSTSDSDSGGRSPETVAVGIRGDDRSAIPSNREQQQQTKPQQCSVVVLCSSTRRRPPASSLDSIRRFSLLVAERLKNGGQSCARPESKCRRDRKSSL